MSIAIKKVSGIILAAGSSSRMGRLKQLMPFGKTTLLGQVVQNACSSALHEIIVVLGYRAEKIESAIDFSGTKVVRNTAYPKGHSTSLIKGLETVSSPCDAALFLLGDQPLIHASIIDILIEASNTSSAQIIVPHYNGLRGNPVLITRSLFPRLEALTGDTGPRVLFKEFKDRLLKVPVFDNAILMDVDTMDDYDKLLTNHTPL